MIHPHYPHFAYNHLLLPVLRTRRVNRRRRRWPAILLGFFIGLLVGWLIRGGGALLP